jgi:hypothetical protein
MRLRPPHTLPLAVLLLCLTGCHGSADHGGVAAGPRPGRPAPSDGMPPSRSVALIPFSLGSNGRMYVQAMVEGRAKATLLIDTGNGLDYLRTAVQDRLHLPSEPLVYGPHNLPTIVEGEHLRWIAPKMTLGGTLTVKGRVCAEIALTPPRLPADRTARGAARCTT